MRQTRAGATLNPKATRRFALCRDARRRLAVGAAELDGTEEVGCEVRRDGC